MTNTNPEYNPDWKQVHEFHSEQHDHLKKIPFDERTKDINDEMNSHLKEMQRCLDTYQHETFSDAVRYAFENFDPAELAHLDNFIEPVDYDSFTSMEQIRQAWSDTDRAVRAIQTDLKQSMETGQPDSDDLPNDIFCDIGGNLQTAPQIFPNRWTGETQVFTTIDRRDDAIYICFLNNNEGVSVVTAIEQFATIMRHQILEALKEENSPKQKQSKKWAVGNMLSIFQKERKQNMPELVFFQHVPPMEYYKETFSRVDLTLSGDTYSDPKWNTLNRIPESLQRVRREKDIKTIPVSSMKRLGKPTQK